MPSGSEEHMTDEIQRIRRDERGQTAAEYVGVVALAAAVIGLMLKLHIAQDVAEGLANSIKTILGH